MKSVFKRFAYFASVIIIICFISKIITDHIFCIDSVSFNFDSLLAKQIKEDLKNQILEALKTKSNRQISSEIKQLYPCVDIFDARLTRPNHIHCSVQTKMPLFMVNTEWVLLQDGQLYNANAFETTISSILPRFILSKYIQKLDDALHSWLNRQNSHVFDLFHVTITNATTIQLKDKSGNLLYLTAHQNITPTLLTAYQKINESHQNQKINSSACIDMRFANQIIYRKIKRG